MSLFTRYIAGSQVKSAHLNALQEFMALYHMSVGDAEGQGTSGPVLRTLGPALAVAWDGGDVVSVIVGDSTSNSSRHSGGMLWMDNGSYTVVPHYEENTTGLVSFTLAAAPGTATHVRWDIIQAKVTVTAGVSALTMSVKEGTSNTKGVATVPTPDAGYVKIAEMVRINGDSSIYPFDMRKPLGHWVYSVPLEYANLAGSWSRDIVGDITAGAVARDVRIPLSLRSMSFTTDMRPHRRIHKISIYGTLTSGGSSAFQLLRKPRAGGSVTNLCRLTPLPAGATTETTMTWAPGGDTGYLTGNGGAVWMNADHVPRVGGAGGEIWQDHGCLYLHAIANNAADNIRSVVVEGYGL